MEPITDIPTLSPSTTQPTTREPMRIVTINVNPKTTDNNQGQNDHEQDSLTSLTPTNSHEQLRKADSFNIFGLSENKLSLIIIVLIAYYLLPLLLVYVCICDKRKN